LASVDTSRARRVLGLDVRDVGRRRDVGLLPFCRPDDGFWPPPQATAARRERGSENVT
jgi:hypothetical protein